MSNYYSQKRKVYLKIEAMIRNSEGIDSDVLIYELTSNYDIAELCITKRIDLLIKLGKVKIDSGFLVWNTEEVSQ